MPIKIFCTVAGLLVTFVAVVLGAVTDVPVWTVAVTLLLVVGGLCWWAAGEIMRGVAFAEVSNAARTWMLRMLTVAMIVHAAWVVVFLLVDPAVWTAAWLRWLAVPPVLAGVEALVAVAWDHRIRRVRALPREDATVAVRDAEVVGRPLTPAELFGEALTRIARDYIEVVGWAELDYGLPLPEGFQGPLGFVFTTRLPSILAVQMAAQAADKRAGRATTRGEIKPLSGDDAEMLAIAWSEVTRVPMMASWVHVTDDGLAGVRTVTVVMCDVHSLAFPYPLHRTHRGPKALLGVRVDARPVELNLRQHLALVGNTGSGKSRALDVLFAELTLSEQEGGPLPELRVGGLRKIYDLVGPWLDALLGTNLPMPFTAVNGFADTLGMLVEVMDEAVRRQGLPHAQRAGLHDIHVCIDELPAFLAHPGQVRWQNRWYTASELYGEARRILRSAGIFLVDLAQQWTNAMYGDSASSIKGNSQALMLMRSMDGDERGDMFGAGGAALGHLYQPGQFYLRDGAAPVSGKTFYIQETDARLSRRHDGPDIAEVALTRARQLAARGVTGPVMTEDYRDYLRGVGAYAPTDDAAAGRSLLDEADDLVAELEGTRPPAVAVSYAAPVKPPTRGDRIVELVYAAEQPLSPTEILRRLHEAGDETSVDMVYKELRKLRQRNRLSQPSEGLYAAV